MVWQSEKFMSSIGRATKKKKWKNVWTQLLSAHRPEKLLGIISAIDPIGPENRLTVRRTLTILRNASWGCHQCCTRVFAAFFILSLVKHTLLMYTNLKYITLKFLRH